MRYNYTITVVCDTGAGDFATETNTVDNDKFETYKKLFELVKKYPPQKGYGIGIHVDKRFDDDYLENFRNEFNCEDYEFEELINWFVVIFFPTLTSDWHSLEYIKITRLPEKIVPEEFMFIKP